MFACGGEETTTSCTPHEAECEAEVTVCETRFIRRNALGIVAEGERVEAWLDVEGELFYCDEPNVLPDGCQEAQDAAEEAGNCD
jgi:hypothetical protein